MTASLNVAVGVRVLLVLRPVEGQVAIPDSQFPSLPSSSSSNTACCASRPLRHRTDGSESIAGTSCSRSNLNGDQLSVRGDALGLTQQEDRRYAVTHFQDRFLLARNVDRRREMGTLRVIMFRVRAGHPIHEKNRRT